MPDSPQVIYSKRLDKNQNARLRQEDAAFRHQLPGQQARLRVLYQRQQLRASVGRTQTVTPPPADATVSTYALAATFMLLFVMPGLFVLAVVTSIRAKHRRRTQDTPQHSYRVATSLLTPTECHFYQSLRQAVGPLAVIQCKVRLADLLIAPRHDFGAFRRVSQKHVDFVLCEAGTLRPLVAVELDDRSHERRDRQDRDRFVDSAHASAGLPLVHVPVQAAYNTVALLSLLQPFLVVDVWGRG